LVVPQLRQDRKNYERIIFAFIFISLFYALLHGGILCFFKPKLFYQKHFYRLFYSFYVFRIFANARKHF
ncbi:hypothetical protein ACT6BE_09205, partial [Campylobacter jejuni]